MKRNEPIDKTLYNKVVQEAKKKFMVWPSAYASGWVVKTYKARGGRYKTANKDETGDDRPLKRWYDEKWVDICSYIEKGEIRPCGRDRAEWKDYPYCRPWKRVSSKTPTTVSELIDKKGKEKVRESCEEKKKNPKQRIDDRKQAKNNALRK